MVRETRVQSQVKSYQRLKKWYLIPPCLTLSNIRYVLSKWSNPGKGVAPSPTPWCSSYQKGSLLVALDYGRQLFNYTIGKKKQDSWHKNWWMRFNFFAILWCENQLSLYGIIWLIQTQTGEVPIAWWLLQHCNLRVWTPVMLLCSLSNIYLWEK